MIYIDNAEIPYGRMKMSHMIADTRSELFQFASQIELSRHWFQDKRIPRFDICQSKKRIALRLGAKLVSQKDLVKIARLNEA